MKKTLLLLAVILVAIGTYMLYARYAHAPSGTDMTGAGQPVRNTYANPAYGLSFSYPDGYVLDEAERGDGHRKHYAIVLIRQEDSAPRENGEGPTAITFDIYQNNLDKQTLVGWLTGTNQSNFKLSPTGTYSSTMVDGVEAVNYRWSGLYEGETTAFLHASNIVAASVTWLTPEDANVGAYRDILASVKLSPVSGQ